MLENDTFYHAYLTLVCSVIFFSACRNKFSGSQEQRKEFNFEINLSKLLMIKSYLSWMIFLKIMFKNL